MATTGRAAAGTAGAAPLPVAAPVGLAAALRSEFTKIRTVRSTYWLLLTAMLGTIGVGLLAAASAPARGMALPGFDPARTSLLGLIFGQPVISVLGALAITSEYSTGMIRTSLAVQPRRGVLLTAKGIVLALTVMATGLVTVGTAFFAGQAIMAGKHVGTGLGQPGVLRAVIGGALFLTVSALIAFGLGAIIRNSAAAVATAGGLMDALQILAFFLSPSWHDRVDKWLPLNSGTQIWATTPDPAQFSPWTGFGVFTGYAVIILLAGWLIFHHRDA